MEFIGKRQVIDIRHLSIGYKKHAVINNINLNANLGSLICIIGRNGTGKTTFLNTISGIIPALSGKIFYNNQDFTNISLIEKSKLISYVASRQEYLSNFTVFDLVSLGRSPYTNIFDKKSDSDREIIDSVIAEFHLENIKHKVLYKISDGERQRSMICRAIVQETPIILLDEPTSFLDYYAKQELLISLSQLTKQKNKCIVFSCHDIELASKFSDTIWLADKNSITKCWEIKSE